MINGQDYLSEVSAIAPGCFKEKEMMRTNSLHISYGNLFTVVIL